MPPPERTASGYPPLFAGGWGCFCGLYWLGIRVSGCFSEVHGCGSAVGAGVSLLFWVRWYRRGGGINGVRFPLPVEVPPPFFWLLVGRFCGWGTLCFDCLLGVGLLD